MIDSVVGAPDVRPFRGWRKWHHVLANVLVALAGTGLVAVVLTQTDVVPLPLLAGYTTYAVVLTLLLAGAFAVTRTLPVLETADGTARIEAFRPEWWYDNGLNAGLAVAGLWLGFLGMREGGDLLVPGLLVGLAGCWFLVPALLAALGRRHNESLRVTADSIELTGTWGSARAPRASVTDVRSAGGCVLVALAEPSDESVVPRPWRGRQRSSPHLMIFDCSMTAHDPEQLARWLRDRLGLGVDQH